MVQYDARAKVNTTIKRKNRKKYFWGSFRCLCPFLVVVGPFSGVQNRKKFRKFVFSGIDLEWSETYFKLKISRKKFSSSFKIFRMATQKFSDQFEGSKAGKTKYFKKLPVQNFSGCRSLQFKIGHRFFGSLKRQKTKIFKNGAFFTLFCLFLQ